MQGDPQDGKLKIDTLGRTKECDYLISIYSVDI
jgi:hypothetical protein